MYLHLGQDYIVRTQDVVGIFDIDTTSTGHRTREFLSRAESEGAVVTLSNEIPKSFILADFPDDVVYISPISSRTLGERCKKFEKESMK